MPAATAYLEENEAPTRAEIDRRPGPLLLEFGTTWCGHCRALAPRIALMLERHPEVQHVKVEDGPGRPLGRSFHVRLWPNFVFLRDGQVVRQLGRPSYAQLDQAFAELTRPA